MDYLKENQDKVVTVGDIYQYLEQQESRVNITTVYRYLDKLVKEGTVMKYKSETGEKATFQYVEDRKGCQNHLHIKCTECGTIRHLDCGFMKEITGHILVHHGFKLQCQNSILYGLCEQCSEKKKD